MSTVYIHYDVALLVLSSPFHLVNTPHIGVGCLEPNLPSPGTVCYSMGWGIDILAKNDSAKILKKVSSYTHLKKSRCGEDDALKAWIYLGRLRELNVRLCCLPRNAYLNKQLLSKIWLQLELPLVEHNECERLLRNTILGDGYKLHKSLTCAGGEVGVDTCEGDGGSPLVCRIPVRT